MSEQQTVTVTDCEALVGQLAADDQEHAARVAALVAERNEFALAAHTGDAKAAARVSAIGKELVACAFAGESRQVARQQAAARLAEAQRAVALAADREEACKLREAVREFVELGVELDAALSDVAAAGQALRETLSKIHQLGSKFPTHEQVNTLGEAALLTKLMNSPWPIRHLAPHERKDFASLVKGWQAAIERSSIVPRLGTEQTIEVNDAAA